MIDALAKEWLETKAQEAKIVARRREIEDAMAPFLTLPAEGSTTHNADGFVIKATTRTNRKVDAERLQEIAAENGLSNHLSSLFRWKPEINLAVWKATDKAITTPLAAAITAEPGRPSFSITKKD